MTKTTTKLKYTNNKRLNIFSGQSSFETFSNLQGNKLRKAQTNHDCWVEGKMLSFQPKNLVANLFTKNVSSVPADSPGPDTFVNGNP